MDKPGDERQRTIYALTDIAPETQAYALARYSRSAASLKESVAWITEQKAADFLETFYFAYGHKSIADMAHITLALENISILAAIEIENEQLWDGQERSTRYQDFAKSRFIIPPELDDYPEAKESFEADAGGLFRRYQNLTKEIFNLLTEVMPRPADMDAGGYKRNLNARALDVTRTLLPYATRTSVGQVTSARVLERQLARLLSSSYSEIGQIAEEIKEICKQPAFSPLAVRVRESMAQLLQKYPEASEALQELAAVVDPVAPAPTLVKYTEPSQQLKRTEELLNQVATEYLGGIKANNSRSVRLVETDPPLIEAVTTLLYRYSALPYHQIQAVVRDMPHKVRLEIYDMVQEIRGPHDSWLREQHAGYSYIFDILLDAKSMQDFFRHRRCIQVRQEITAQHGFVNGAEWFNLGLPKEALALATEKGLAEQYDRAMYQAALNVEKIADFSLTASHYLIPLGYKRRALFKMDDAQAAYIIETRSQVLGHFAYRQAAYKMWEEFNKVQPEIARWIRVIPFEQTDYLKR